MVRHGTVFVIVWRSRSPPLGAVTSSPVRPRSPSVVGTLAVQYLLVHAIPFHSLAFTALAGFTLLFFATAKKARCNLLSTLGPATCLIR